jgi:hypothetical protein
MLNLRSVVLCLGISLLPAIGYAQGTPRCPAPPGPPQKFRDLPAGQTISLPAHSKWEFRVASTPAGCAVTTIVTLPGGNRLWLPAGKVFDSPDKSFQNNGAPITYEAQPAGEFNNWRGWLDTSRDEPGNCDPSVDQCPEGANLIHPQGSTSD